MDVLCSLIPNVFGFGVWQVSFSCLDTLLVLGHEVRTITC